MIREKITVSFLKKLKVGELGKYEDIDTPNLQVWVGKKSIAYYLIKKVDGRQHNINIGRYPDMTLEEARQEVLKKLGALANHESISSPSARKNPLLGEAIDFFLAEIENPKTKRDNTSFLEKFSALRGRKIADLTKADISLVHASLRDTPVMANHAVKKLATAISRFSKKLNIAIENPARGIKLYPEKPRLRFLTEEEAPRILEALKKLQNSFRHKVQADALLVMIYTGQRKSNVLSMAVSEIQNGIWVIPAEKSKSRKEIVVPLNEYALEIVQRRQEKSKYGYLFETGRNGKDCQHLQDVRKTFDTACQMAGVTDCHIHDLRRTLGSWMLMSGVPISVVSKTLGHSSIAITEQVYAHLLPGKIADATTEAVSNMLKGKA